MKVVNNNKKNLWFTHEPAKSDFNEEAHLGNDIYLVNIAIGTKNIVVGDYDMESKKFRTHLWKTDKEDLELNDIVAWQPISGYPNCC